MFVRSSFSACPAVEVGITVRRRSCNGTEGFAGFNKAIEFLQVLGRHLDAQAPAPAQRAPTQFQSLVEAMNRANP